MARLIFVFLFSFGILSVSGFSQEPFWNLAPGTGGFPIADIAIAPSNPDSIFVGGDNLLLLSTDGGTTWDSVAPGPCCGVLAVDQSHPSVLWLNETGLPFEGNAVLVSTDNGIGWQQHLLGHCIEEEGCAAPILAYGPSGAPGLYASVNPFFMMKTVDGGASWDSVAIPVHVGLWSILPSAQPSSVIYLGYADPVTVYRTDDGGITWDERPLPILAISAIHLAIDPNDHDILYAGVEEVGIYKSTDGGLSWIPKNGGLTADQFDFKSILVNPHQPLEVFVGLGDDDPLDGFSDLIAVSVDGGGSWSSLSTGLPTSGQVSRLVVDPREFRLLAAVVAPHDSFAQAGVYRAGILTSAGGDSPDHPLTARLHQNYPNPFNPSTRITFDLPIRQQISLVVDDILGRRVAVLSEGAMEAGRHTVEWSPDAMSSGVYFLTLVTGTTQITRTVMLIR